MVAVGLAGGQTPAAEKRRAWWHVEVTGRSGDGKREREAVCGGILVPVWAALRRAEYVEVQNDPASPSHPSPPDSFNIPNSSFLFVYGVQ
jgi:hypothetical protein